MKKFLALLAAVTVIFCSCVKNSDDRDFNPASDPAEKSGAVTTESAESMESSGMNEAENTPSRDERESRNGNLYKIIKLNIPDFHARDSGGTFEDFKKKYPDKTALVWQLNPLIDPPPEEAINSYLDSLGKHYAVYFRTAPADYRDSKFSADLTYSTYDETLAEILESGAQTDIIDAFSVYNELALNGQIEPIDGFLSGTAEGRKLYETMPENYWKGCMINGRIYGVCSYLTLGRRSGYFVNSVLADEYGYDIDKPILDQLEILNQIKKEPCDAVITWKNFSQAADCSFGRCLENCVIWDDEEKTAKSIIADEGYRETLRTYFELNKAGFVTEMPTKQSFFIYEENLQYPADSQNACDRLYTQLGENMTAVAAYAASPTGTKISPSNIGVCVAAGSENKDEAFDLIATVFTDPQLNNMLCYGENYAEFEQNGGIFLAGDDICRAWVFLNPLISIPPLTEPADLARRWAEGVKAAEVSDDIDFAFDASGFKDIRDAIRAVTVEMSRDIFNEKYESFEDYISEYSERLDKAGQQTVIDEANRQYAEYLENNNR